MQDTFANVVAGIIQIIPLIAVPFFLKGVIDSVPVVGKALQRGFNSTFNAADKGHKALGIGAVRRAQVLNGERNMLGMRNRSGNPTLLENIGNRKSARDSRVKAIGTGRDARFKSAMADADPEANINPLSIGARAAQQARIAHDQTEDAEHLGKETGQRLTNAFDAERLDASTVIGQREQRIQNEEMIGGRNKQNLQTGLSERRVLDPTLRAIDQDTQASALAERNATNIRQDRFGEALQADEGLLTVAAGSVDSVRGRTRAMAAATSAGFKVFDEGVSAQESLLTQRLADIQKGTYQVTDPAILNDDAIYERNKDKTFKLDANGNKIINGAQASQAYLKQQLRSSDTMEVAAARNKLLAQGASGVTAFKTEWSKMQDDGHFDRVVTGANGEAVNMNDVRVEIERNTVAQHGPQIKAKEKSVLAAFTSGRNISDVANDAATWTGQNDNELAESTTSHLLTGIQNGGISAERAAAILSDDVIRNKYNQEQIQILQVLKDGGSDPITVKKTDAKGATIDVKTTQGKAAVEAIWNTSSGKLRTMPNSGNTTGETNDTINISAAVAPGIQVPGIGSPPKTIQDFIDQAGGVSRLSRDNFVRLQTTVATAAGPQDNEDLVNMRAAVAAEVQRRNEEAAKINEAAGQTIYTTIGGGVDRTVAPTVTVQSASTPGTAYTVNTFGETSSQPRPTPAGVRTQLVTNVQNIARSYNTTAASIGISADLLNSVSQPTQERINVVLEKYVQQSNLATTDSAREASTNAMRQEIADILRDEGTR